MYIDKTDRYIDKQNESMNEFNSIDSYEIYYGNILWYYDNILITSII